jgi:hypothetical protein
MNNNFFSVIKIDKWIINIDNIDLL